MARSYILWSYAALAMVMIGALQSVYSQEVQLSGAPSRVQEANVNSPMNVYAEMRSVLLLYNENGTNLENLSPRIRRYVSDGSTPKNFIIPPASDHSDAAIYYRGFYDPRCRLVKNNVRCTPSGSFLVIFRDGKEQAVDGTDVRVINRNGRTILEFPRGKASPRRGLPKLPEYEAPLFLPD